MREKMCKKLKGCGRRIDPCMKIFINTLKHFLDKSAVIVACCCGHNKYKMSIVCRFRDGRYFDLVNDTWIPRKRRFYKKDKQGYYFIPEVLE
jgi:hypothetical protein